MLTAIQQPIQWWFHEKMGFFSLYFPCGLMNWAQEQNTISVSLFCENFTSAHKIIEIDALCVWVLTTHQIYTFTQILPFTFTHSTSHFIQKKNWNSTNLVWSPNNINMVVHKMCTSVWPKPNGQPQAHSQSSVYGLYSVFRTRIQRLHFYYLIWNKWSPCAF